MSETPDKKTFINFLFQVLREDDEYNQTKKNMNALLLNRTHQIVDTLTEFHFMPSGSQAEDTTALDWLLPTEDIAHATSDNDYMFVFKDFTAQYGNITVETENCHPGFARLKCTKEFTKVLNSMYEGNRTEKTKCSMSIKGSKKASDDDLTIQSVTFNQSAKKKCEEYLSHKSIHGIIRTRFMGASMNRHGPALNPRNSEDDLLPAIRCSTQKFKEFNQVYERINCSKQISKELKERVRCEDVHLVPTVHKLTSEQHKPYEWRVSTSLIEAIFCRNWSPTQRLTYKLLKLLKYFHFKHTPVTKNLICSYYFKTCVYWAIEDSQTGFWRAENLFVCVERVLGILIDFFKQGNLPSYFLPSNNIVDHIPQSDLMLLISQLRKLKNNCKNQIWCCLSEDMKAICKNFTTENNDPQHSFTNLKQSILSKLNPNSKESCEMSEFIQKYDNEIELSYTTICAQVYRQVTKQRYNCDGVYSNELHLTLFALVLYEENDCKFALRVLHVMPNYAAYKNKMIDLLRKYSGSEDIVSLRISAINFDSVTTSYELIKTNYENSYRNLRRYDKKEFFPGSVQEYMPECHIWGPIVAYYIEIKCLLGLNKVADACAWFASFSTYKQQIENVLLDRKSKEQTVATNNWNSMPNFKFTMNDLEDKKFQEIHFSIQVFYICLKELFDME